MDNIERVNLMLKAIDDKKQQIIDAIDARDPKLCRQLQEELFTLEDCLVIETTLLMTGIDKAEAA